jgi:hypothetical protein
MAHPQAIEGTGEELERYLKERRQDRFRLIPLQAHEERPFHETATTEEWIAALYAWSSSHDPRTTPLPDEAMSRDSIYEGRA